MSWKTLVTLCITKSKICFTLQVSIHETYSWDKYFLPILNYYHWYYELPLNKIKTEIKKASLKNLRPNQVEKHGKYKSIPRDGSRTAAASKMELFVIIVNGFQPLSIITKCSILDVTSDLDPPLIPIAFITSAFILFKYQTKRHKKFNLEGRFGRTKLELPHRAKMKSSWNRRYNHIYLKNPQWKALFFLLCLSHKTLSFSYVIYDC